MDLSLYDIYVKSDNKLQYVIYGDTDSFFISLFDLYCKKYNISSKELSNLLVLDMNDVETNKLQEIYGNVKLLASEIKDCSYEKMVNYLKTKMNCKRENTIDFEFEYLASYYRTIAKKTYVYKQFLKKGIKKKNFGVKRSDPILTKLYIDTISKNLFLYDVGDNFFYSLTSIIKDYISNLDNFSKECGIPTSISSNISTYKTFTIQLKSLVTYSSLKHLVKNKDNIQLPSSTGNEYKGFRFTVNLTSELMKYIEVIKNVFDKFAEVNKVIKFKNDVVTNIFMPDNFYFSSNNEELLKVIKKYVQPDYFSMLDAGLYSYLKRLAGISFTDKFHEYVLSTDKYDVNIIKKHVVYVDDNAEN